jgi:hypothetical protein
MLLFLQMRLKSGVIKFKCLRIKFHENMFYYVLLCQDNVHINVTSDRQF